MTDSSEPVLLTVAGLLVEVAERPLLTDFNLKVEESALIEIKGPNGSGKTTLLRYLAGIRRAHKGSIDYRDHDFAYVGQKPGLNASLTVFENLKWLTRNADQDISDSNLLLALSDLGLKSMRDTPVGALSAGQVKRCGLASLLALNAKIWLLDEPLTSLDEAAISWLKVAITSHRAARGATILATHAGLGLPDTTTIDLNAS
ncbi:MAG: heme ABC exporter ATP-binding protein CcmA [Gammaproteobacteria bacterium]|nr:heme ABC exporter ATP-binding protein CcmA [Gammaproteobacteria bacterium]